MRCELSKLSANCQNQDDELIKVLIHLTMPTNVRNLYCFTERSLRAIEKSEGLKETEY